MSVLRVCTSYPADRDISHPSFKILRYAQEEVVFLKNVTKVYRREDKVKACFDLMARNETDVITIPTATKYSLPFVRFFPPADQSPPSIIASYHLSQSTSKTNVVSSLSSFSWSVVLIISCLTLVSLVLMTTHSRLYRHHKRFKITKLLGAYWASIRRVRPPQNLFQILLTLVLRQISSSPVASGSSRKSLAFKLTLLSVVLLFFYVHFYFVAYIRAEMVTVSKAVTIESFEQVLNTPGLKPKWLTYDLSHREFKRANKGTMMHRLWLKSQPNPVIPLDDKIAVQAIVQITKSEIVLTGDSPVMDVVFLIVCPAARRLLMPSLTLRSSNFEEAAFVKALVYNERMNEKWVTALSHRILLSAQSGIMRHILKDSVAPPTDREEAWNQRACREGIVNESPIPVVDAKVPSDFWSLFNITGGLLIAATVVLVMELIHQKNRKRRPPVR